MLDDTQQINIPGSTSASGEDWRSGVMDNDTNSSMKGQARIMVNFGRQLVTTHVTVVYKWLKKGFWIGSFLGIHFGI
jgi:hypothetical protein